MVLELLLRVFNFKIPGISNQNLMWSNSVCTTVELFHLSADVPSHSKHCLTLKAPNKNCSRRHFHFTLLSFEENKG